MPIVAAHASKRWLLVGIVLVGGVALGGCRAKVELDYGSDPYGRYSPQSPAPVEDPASAPGKQTETDPPAAREPKPETVTADGEDPDERDER